MNFKTDRAKVLGLGSAKSGAEHWFGERLKSVALIPLTIIFVLIIGLVINFSSFNNINFKKSYLILMIFPLLFSSYISFKEVKSSFLDNKLRLDLMQNKYSKNVRLKVVGLRV